MSKFKRVLAVVLTVATLAGLLMTGASAAGFTRSRTYTEGMFTDIPANAWYAVSVKDCYELGLMSGNGDGTFNPSGMFTLAEAATVSARLHNIHRGGSGVIPAADGAWYQGAVNYCIENGIFAENQFSDYLCNATRAQMAGMVYNALPSEAWASINSVRVLPDVSDTTLNSAAILALYNAGVFTGNDEYGMFQPHAYITRAEVAAIVARVADTGQRRTFSLTPLSSRLAIELPNASDFSLSEGIIRYTDSETGKVGYMKTDGTVIAPAKYKDGYDFKEGYALVRYEDSSIGFIDSNGKELLPSGVYLGGQYMDYQEYIIHTNGISHLFSGGKVIAEYSVHCGRYSLDHNGELIIAMDDVYSEDPKYGVISRDGRIIIPCEYSDDDILVYGSIIRIANPGKYDIYDFNGTLIDTIAKSEWEQYAYPGRPEPWLYKENGKYGLAGHGGKITEALYDDIQINSAKKLSILSYAGQEALAGLNGIILNLGQYDIMNISDEYACVKSADNRCAIADSTGIVYEFDFETSSPLFAHNIDNILFISMYLDRTKHYAAYDTATGQVYGIDQVEEIFGGYCYDGNYILFDGTRIPEAPTENGRYYTFVDMNGKYGLLNKKQEVVEPPIHDTAEEALNAYGWYEESKENGKPIITFGNYETTQRPVIRYYREPFYYDEIKELGDGYYVCRFSDTWYLVHA